MRIKDCYWEKENIGCTTAEISVGVDDKFDKDVLIDICNRFDYVVVKVPMRHPSFNMGLSELGFVMFETQINISKTYKAFPFEDRLVKMVYPHITDRIVDSEDEFEEVIDKITPDMFSTDRIYLDTYFPHDYSSRRYKNWMKTEFHNKTSIIKTLYYDGVNVGWEMSRENDGIRYGLLGGLFQPYQSKGLGILTASNSFMTAKRTGKPFKLFRTSISSNNTPMMQFYNYLGFRVDNMTYVFIKHNN